MQQLIFVYPGDLNSPTGGYAYDRRIIAGLQSLRWEIQLIGLGEGYPFPNPAQVKQAKEHLQGLAPGVPMVIDGLAFGALPEVAACVAEHHPLIALIHHPLAFEFGLSQDQAALLKQSETEALRHASKVIANSPATAHDLNRHYGVPMDRIDVVLPGTDRSMQQRERSQITNGNRNAIRLLSVGSIIPRKGFHDLLAALAPLADLPWTLSIAGDTTRNAGAFEQLIGDITRFGFEGRVHVLGAVSDSELDILYTQADAFVLASLFEGYGMVYAEAMAYGLPIIATSAGAIPDTVPSEAGLLVNPGDIAALTLALKTIIEDAPSRARLSSGALQAAAQQPTWDQATQQFATALERLTPA
ncbi:MAG: glycosyltransferase family 4 protein [Polynucleobacter sp.]